MVEEHGEEIQQRNAIWAGTSYPRRSPRNREEEMKLTPAEILDIKIRWLGGRHSLELEKDLLALCETIEALRSPDKVVVPREENWMVFCFSCFVLNHASHHSYNKHRSGVVHAPHPSVRMPKCHVTGQGRTHPGPARTCWQVPSQAFPHLKLLYPLV